MSGKKIPVRNANGRLLGNFLYANDHWSVVIKEKNCYTVVTLQNDGSFEIDDVMIDRPADDR